MGFLRIVGLALAFFVFAGLMGFGIFRSSLPVLDGTQELAGLDAQVIITRDAYGVPHISAASDKDLYFALGYTHAQDRLFQMDINRRIGKGRLAEILGAQGLGFDKYFRTLGFYRSAGSAYANLPTEAREALQIYAAGVNAFIVNQRMPLPPEFELLNYQPEPWHPTDTLVWQKMMWLDLSGNHRQEAIRALLLTKLSPEQVESIYPTYPGETEAPLPRLEEIYEDLPIKADLFARTQLALGPEKTAGYGSNNWVVSGEHTKSGLPLLANDPHLGLSTPSIWYLVRLHNRSTNRNAIGVGFPGTPGIVLGRNDRIAWGFTNTYPDIQDLYIEKLIGETEYQSPDGPQKLTLRKERIDVRGGESVLLTVKSTRHGPIVSDIVPEAKDLTKEDYAISLAWTAFEPQDNGFYALLKIMGADNFEEFTAIASQYQGPEQNMIFADIDGNIGYYAPARVPVRHPDNDIKGRLPSPGWDAKYDWQGFIPSSEMPKRYNPENGVIATANEKIVDHDYPHFITREWSLPYRGNRIRHQLAENAPHDLASFAELHGDIVSDPAREIKPLLIQAARKTGSKHTDLLKLIEDWDGAMKATDQVPLIYQSWVQTFQTQLMQDDLGDLYDRVRALKPRLVKSVLHHAVAKSVGEASGDASGNTSGNTSGESAPYYALPALDKDVSLSWCGEAAACLQLASDSLDITLADLEARYGSDRTQWNWGRAHMLSQNHRPFASGIPLLGSVFSLTSPQDGSRYTVNVAGNSSSVARPHTSSFGPSYRGLFDFSDLDKSLYVQPTGQSGHPASLHHNDLFPLWNDTSYIEIPATPSGEAENAIHRLVLRPKSR